MFTGIIEELGKIQKVTSEKIKLECHRVLEDSALGDSISVNGVCLTISSLEDNSFIADVSPETLQVTAPFKPGNYVNLERALPANGRFGGHIVSGHIDCRGEIIEICQQGSFYNIKIKLPPELSKYTVKKGSIAVNGISLTIAETNNTTVNIAVIPHTYENTNLKYLKSGDYVNIETDVLSKYVENFLSTSDNKSRLDLNFLRENGF